jgi:hypothetical protein
MKRMHPKDLGAGFRACAADNENSQVCFEQLLVPRSVVMVPQRLAFGVHAPMVIHYVSKRVIYNCTQI